MAGGRTGRYRGRRANAPVFAASTSFKRSGEAVVFTVHVRETEITASEPKTGLS